jgi:hypothetical protein
MDKIKNIPIIHDWEANPKDEGPKIHDASTPSEAVMNITSNTVIEERQHSTRMSRRLKRNPVTRHEDFFMVNKCIKISAVNNKLTHTERGVTRNMQVTTEPEDLQSSLAPANLLDNIVPLKNITTEALHVYHQNIQGLRWKSSEVLNFLCPDLPYILCFNQHHLIQHQIEVIQIDIYTLGSSFCRSSFKMMTYVFFLQEPKCY